MNFKINKNNKLNYLNIRQLIELVLYGYYPLPEENEEELGRKPTKLNSNNAPEIVAVKAKVISLLIEGHIYGFGQKGVGPVQKTVSKETLYGSESKYSCNEYEEEHSRIPADVWSYDYVDWDESSNYLAEDTCYKNIIFPLEKVEYLAGQGLDAIKCSHFKVCGGCDLQQLSSYEYFRTKFTDADNIIKALKINHFVKNQDIIIIGPYSRRRVSFKVKKGKIGFYEKQSHDIVNLVDCVILEPKVFGIYKKIRSQIKFLDKIEEISILNSDSGLDVFFTFAKQPKEKMLTELIDFGVKNQITRLATNYQLLISGRITLEAANVEVELPTESFLQATKKSETALIDLVFQATLKSKYIADLFAGCGTYAFNLHKSARVELYESSPEMHEATKKACAKYTKCHSFMRDLFKYPLTKLELIDYDTVIINPPRAGALNQTKELINHKVQNVIMVSCNSETFIRDAGILLEGGYKLKTFKIVDQFFYTKHLEIFAHFVI